MAEEEGEGLRDVSASLPSAEIPGAEELVELYRIAMARGRRVRIADMGRVNEAMVGGHGIGRVSVKEKVKSGPNGKSLPAESGTFFAK